MGNMWAALTVLTSVDSWVAILAGRKAVGTVDLMAEMKVVKWAGKRVGKRVEQSGVWMAVAKGCRMVAALVGD